MNERTQDARSTAQTVATGDDSTAPATGAGAATVHALIARGQRDPNVIAAVVQDNPGATAEIFMFLNQTLGNRFVQAVLSVLAPGVVGAATGAMRVIAHGLHVRSSPDKASDKNIIGTLRHHETVEATGRHGGWVGIEHASKPAFVFGRYLEPAPKHAAPAGPVEGSVPAAKTVAPTVPAASAPAVAHHAHDATPVVAHHDHPKVAPVEHHGQKAASGEHHDAPKITPVVAPPKPVEHHDEPKPSPKSVEHHDAAPVAPAQTATPTVTPTAPAQLANVDAAPAHVNGKAISKILKLPRPLPQVHAFLPAGGVRGNAEVFLFLHGMFAHHDRSHDKGFRLGKDINDPNPDEAMNLAGAMAATTRNLVTLAPVAHFAGEWPLWRELADNKGFKELIAQSLDQLSTELSITPPISIGSISIAGHSAGGSGLGEAAKQLGDKIHDMTYEDGGYADKPGKGTGWKDSHDKVAAWLLGGESDKILRVLLHGEHNRLESTILHSHFNKESLEHTARTLKKAGVTVTRDEGNHDKRSADKGMYLDHMLHVHGLPGTRTVTVFNMPSANHMQLRNRATEHLITEGRDTEFETDAVAPTGPLKAAGDMPVDTHAGRSHAKQHDNQKPASVAPHVDAHPAPSHVETKAAKPKGRHQERHPTRGYDRDDRTDLDSFGNPTERTKRTEKNLTTDNHRVFTNQFTTVSKAALVTHDLKDAHKSLAKGTVLHTYDVNGKYAQIVTADITREDNLWISFKYLGGDGSTKPEFGNEKEDVQDKARADAIRDRLPKTGRNPGASKHKWQFTGAFLPSSEGIALDGSLMSKVNALMEWAVAEDMITDDIEIRSGVRPPITAHKMCIRFQLAHRDGANVDFDAIRQLPGGMYHGWKFCPEPGKSTDEAIKKQAHVLYDKHGGSGAQAAAGFAPGAPGRSPLKDSGPGVSKHCPGHAVDIRIPWRSEKDPATTDLWAWEAIYHQFGLTRPLHKDRGFSGHDAEHWHIEETGKQLAGAAREGGD